MASIVPVGLLIARRYVGNNPSIEAGWIQHGLLFAAAVFVSCAVSCGVMSAPYQLHTKPYTFHLKSLESQRLTLSSLSTSC